MYDFRAEVLVIDDSPTVCKLVTSILTDQNIQVTQAYSMEDALEVLNTTARPDLVLTDIMMPGIGGLAGISYIRGKWPDMGIIAMTGGTEALSIGDSLAAARRLGADAVLRKPFEAEALAEKVESIIESYGADSKRKRILVVDDSSTICKMLAGELAQCGYTCKTALSIEEAFDSVDIVGLDLVITDIFMPGLGGIGGIERIRENWPKVRIIAISGGLKMSDGQDALKAAIKIGAHAALKKPFDMALLGTTIEQVLGE